MEIVCKKCGSINDYKTQLKNNQNTAWCNVCGSFIKNIPYAEPALYFGKYKGRKIKSLTTPEETQYLHWLINSYFRLSPHIEKAIKKHLNVK